MTYVKEKAFDDKKEEERHLKGKEKLMLSCIKYRLNEFRLNRQPARYEYCKSNTFCLYRVSAVEK